MKNLNLTFVAIIFALFALTSCEKESMNEMTQNTQTETTERNLPNGPINIVNEDVKTFASKATFAEQATSRSREITWIDPLGVTLYGSTTNEGNSLDDRYYPSCLNTGETFNGYDKIYYLDIDRDLAGNHVTHYFKISELTADLDLFLFALDHSGYISECKGLSITGGDYDEMIEVKGLNQGAYIVVVDGFDSEIAGDFKFEKYTSMVSPNPPTADPEGPENPPVGGAQSMQNARFIDFLGGDAGLTGNGWMVTRNGQSEIFENYEATATVLTMNSYKVVDGKEIETTITFNKSTKMVTSKTTWKKQYSSGSSSWSASIRDIDYAN